MEWIKAEDGLPAVDTKVLVYYTSTCSISGRKMSGVSFGRRGFNFDGSHRWSIDSNRFDYIQEVTHWMPIPEKPKQ